MTVEQAWMGADGRPVLHLHRITPEKALLVKSENLPDLMPAGEFKDIPGTGNRIYVGPDAIRAGAYGVTLGTYGQTHGANFHLQREVIAAAVRTRFIYRSDGGTLPIAGFSKIGRTLFGSTLLSGEITAEFMPASPYWIYAGKSRTVTSGSNTPLHIAGDAPTPLRVTITAGASPVVNPSFSTDVPSDTIWLGTVPAGQTLIIDSGRNLVTLNGVNVGLKLSGPLPELPAGSRNVRLVAAGATAKVEWQEGRL